MNFFNTGIIFTLEIFILCKKVRGPGSVNFDIPSEYYALELLKENLN